MSSLLMKFFLTTYLPHMLLKWLHYFCTYCETWSCEVSANLIRKQFNILHEFNTVFCSLWGKNHFFGSFKYFWNMNLPYSIRMYWTNFWHPTVHVKQNIFEKTLIKVGSSYLYAFASKWANFWRHSESLKNVWKQ